MAGYFSEADLQMLRQGQAELPGQLRLLREAYILRPYKSAQALEHAQLGFCRRLGTLVHAIDSTFELLPPELEEIPDRNTVMDAAIAIQAFVMNAFGCLDNLAWIWVLERAIKGKGGGDLDRKDVGLGKKHVQKSFTDEFRAYMESRKDWLGNLINFRDSLAHRIPLYVPPYVIDETAAEQHKALDLAALEAMRNGDQQEYDRLRAEQRALGHFRPWMTHSIYEQAPTVVFHRQLLQDYVTIDEFGWMLIEEMDKQA